MNGPFASRREAGRELGEAVAKLVLRNAIVLALPRGGVPVGLEVARRLHAPMDLLFVRKIGAPGHPEYGIGAVVDGSAPSTVIDQRVAKLVGASSAYIEAVVARELAEIERRRGLYRTGPAADLEDRSVILVDDGIATGGTVKAALNALAQSRAREIILAIPVAPPEALANLRLLCDRLICLRSPSPFYAVGAHYVDFTQTTDREVIEAMAAANRPDPSSLSRA